MSRLGWGALGVLALWGGIVWLRRRGETQVDDPMSGSIMRERRTAAPPHRRTQDDEIDYEALEEAEREVKDMDADGRGRPKDDTVGDDWGPGTPKPPFA